MTLTQIKKEIVGFALMTGFIFVIAVMSPFFWALVYAMRERGGFGAALEVGMLIALLISIVLGFLVSRESPKRE